ncbi:MAG: hypothetical protein ACREKN_01060 [Longimicrobiaceae bacterium]
MNQEVRTDFFEAIAERLRIFIFCQNFGLFALQNETGRQFEPIICFLLKSRQFVFERLLLVDEPVPCGLILGKR